VIGPADRLIDSGKRRTDAVECHALGFSHGLERNVLIAVSAINRAIFSVAPYITSVRKIGIFPTQGAKTPSSEKDFSSHAPSRLCERSFGNLCGGLQAIAAAAPEYGAR
jgi:hypothetical protein